jgi:hypothetical protein
MGCALSASPSDRMMSQTSGLKTSGIVSEDPFATVAIWVKPGAVLIIANTRSQAGTGRGHRARVRGCRSHRAQRGGGDALLNGHIHADLAERVGDRPDGM